MNVAHNEIGKFYLMRSKIFKKIEELKTNKNHFEFTDLANPKTNTKNAGFSKEEREGMTDLLNLGFIDTFRHLYPNDEKKYTFWTYMGSARTKNVGWRLDYALLSENLLSKVVDSFMRPEILGSDHCPIVLTLNL